MMQYKPGNASLSTIHNPTLAAGRNHMKSSQLSCLPSLHPLHYSPSVLYQAQLSLIPWTWVQWWLQIMVSGKKSPWMSWLPLQWSKDEDDDQAQMMSSSQLIDVPLYWRRRKNSFYIIFITQGNCFIGKENLVGVG